MAKKILIGVAVFLVLLIGAVVAIPFLFKDQINAALKEEINKQVNAKVDYSDYDLSIIRSFPNLSFGLSNFSVIGVGDFKGDTLVYIKDFDFTMDIMTVIRGEKYKILELILYQPKIYATINKLGKANWDIAKSGGSSSSGSGSSKFSLEIKKYKIATGRIIYYDQKGGTYASIINLDFEGSGDVTQDLYKLSTTTKIGALTFKSGAVSYLSSAKIEAKNDIDVDQKNSKYTFKNNEIDLNDLGLLFDGFVKTSKDNTTMDVTFKSKKADFKSILSLIPAIYQKDFDKIKTSGSLVLDGRVNGIYSQYAMPAINLNLKVDNAMFQYPTLPTAVTGINIAASVVKPQGTFDLAVIDIAKMHLNIGADPIDAVINVKTPVSDPNVTAKINGKIDLATVPKLYPMEGLKQMSGLLVAALDFKGRMSDVNKKNYQAIQAAGNLKVTNMVYDSKSTPMPVRVSDLALTFNPRNVTLNSLNAVLGKSDFNASGSLDNFLGYMFSKGDLIGNVTLRSNKFDANEWLTKDDSKPASGAAKTTATTSGQQQFFQVPKGIDFTANSQFGTVLYDKMTLTNVKGTVIVKDEAIDLRNLFANIFGGSATISAVYSTKSSKTPKVNFTYDIKNFDIGQTAQGVGMAAKMAPVIKYLQGNFSSDLKGSGSLKEDMSVDYNSLQGDGKVQIPSARVVNMPIIQKIAEVTKLKALDNLAITNAWTVLKFKDGKVAVDPTDLKFGNGYSINLKGSNGFDESIDYDVVFNVPSKELGPANDLVNKIPKIPGVEFKMPETINIGLKVGGTMTKPTVAMGKVGGNGGSVTDVVKNAAEQVKQKATDAAKDAATKIQNGQGGDVIKDAEQKAKDAAKNFKLPF
jgi:hypothetical protein